jgi:hypothetical protein
MAGQPKRIDPFVTLEKLMGATLELHSQIRTRSPSAQAMLQQLLTVIMQMVDERENATLAAIHLSQHSSPVKQSVYMTVFAYLTSKLLKLDLRQRDALLTATLTCNMSFYELQVLLNAMEGKLSEDQRQKIQRHPLTAAEQIEKAGILDPMILRAIRQHHERIDGSGYPNRIRGEDISTLALVTQICEIYSARIDARSYRRPVLPREALADLYQANDERLKELLVAFARAIGIYPPGTWVKLASNETAIVVSRSASHPLPGIRALFDASDKPYYGPLERDCGTPDFKITGAANRPSLPAFDLKVLFDAS